MFIFEYLLALIIIILLTLTYYIKRFKTHHDYYWREKGVPFYQPKSYLKSYLNFYTKEESALTHLEYLRSKYKSSPYIGIIFINKPILIVKSPQLIKTILVRDAHKFITRVTLPQDRFDAMTYHSLFFTSNEEWNRRRKIIEDIFKDQESILPMVSELNFNHLSKFHGATIKISETISKFYIDLMYFWLFGGKIDAKSDFYQDVNELIELDSKRNLYLLGMVFCPNYVDVMKMLLESDSAIDAFLAAFKERKDTTILRKLQAFGDDNINKLRAQALELFIAAIDTSSQVASLLICELAINPEIQQKLRREIVEINKKFGGISYKNLDKMVYLDMIFKETLRKYPLFGFLIRENSEEYTFEETGLKLEPNTTIIIANNIHLSDPEIYPDPENFDPERFKPENLVNNADVSIFKPFGEGPRCCPARSFGTLIIKIAVALLIKDYTFENPGLMFYPLRIKGAGCMQRMRDPIYLKICKMNEQEANI